MVMLKRPIEELHKPDIKSYTETKTFRFHYMYENMNNNPKNRSILCFLRSLSFDVRTS